MRLLLLGGTQEARHIANALVRESPLWLTVSLARADRRPEPYGWPVRIGGFGGEEAFTDWLRQEGVDAVIDATHPFATGMNFRAARVCEALGIDIVRFLRPAWMPTDADKWVFVSSNAEAARHVPEGATVLLATGRRDLDEFRTLEGRTVLTRVRDRPDGPFPFPGGRFVYQPGPFTIETEARFLEEARVDWLVARNSGGLGSWPKIEAARLLGLPVAMIRRPLQPDVLKLGTVAETLTWVRRRL